ncbi:MAG TPA: NAD(P)-binding domain-containing protein [Candidatus Angelobacter sp.]|nr:NAD(P)-binding domain-containing protein [Candidatus Angelobacter sp.]
MPNTRFDVGFIGTGSMGGMLVRAFLGSEVVPTEHIWLANRSRKKLELLASEFPGVHCGPSERVAQQSEILFIAVKPSDTANVLTTIEHNLRADHLCVFLTNVFSFAQLEQRLPCAVAKLIPTVTQQINQGAALVGYGSRTTPEHARRLEQLLAPTCRLLHVEEHQIRLFGDITSCGPAFLALCIDELCRQASAIAPSLSGPELATACIETLAATTNLLRTGMKPRELICEVAVPGGMTEAGMNVLRQLLPPLFASLFSATRQAEQQKREALPL